MVDHEDSFVEFCITLTEKVRRHIDCILHIKLTQFKFSVIVWLSCLEMLLYKHWEAY